MSEKKQLFSPLTIILALAAAFIFWHLRFVAILMFVSFVVTVILLPLVRYLKKYHIPAAFAALIPIAALSGLLTAVGFYLVPAIRKEFTTLLGEVSNETQELSVLEEFNIEFEQVQEYFSNQSAEVSQIALGYGTSIVIGIIGIVMVIVIAMYWLSSYDRIKETLVTYVPLDHRARMADIWDRIEQRLGKWVYGQVLVSSAIGLVTWLAATLLGLPYAGVLGIIAALLEIIPTIGPIVAAIPAVAIGLNESVQKGVIVAVVYTAIQQVEGYVVSPILMGKTVKLHPIAIILSLLVGSALFGFVGALFAVPGALVVSAFVDSYRNESNLAIEKPAAPQGD